MTQALESEPSPQAQALDTVIAQSAQTIAAEKSAAVKRPRGRPKKVRSVSTLPAPQVGLAGPELAEPETPTLKPYIQTALGIPFAIAATNYGCEELALSNAESEPLAENTEVLLKEYFPALFQSSEGKVFVVLGSLAMICLSKYAILKEHQHRQLEAAKKAQEPPRNPRPLDDVSVFPSMPSA